MKMKMLLPLATAAAAIGGLSGCATYGDQGYGYSNDPYGYYDRSYYDRYGRYDYNTPDPQYGGYYADNYYRTDRRYREYRLGENDRVYRGRDGRYYCRRSDGTTGLIVGGVAGGVLGNIIAPGGSKTLGTVLGAIGGGAVGAAVDSNNRDVRCR
jgi:Outer membrane lipoprotein